MQQRKLVRVSAASLSLVIGICVSSIIMVGLFQMAHDSLNPHGPAVLILFLISIAGGFGAGAKLFRAILSRFSKLSYRASISVLAANLIGLILVVVFVVPAVWL